MSIVGRIFSWLLGLGIIGTLVALFVWRAGESKSAAQGRKSPLVKVGKPLVRDLAVTISYPADLQAMQAYDIRPLEAKGTITYLEVDKGDLVKKGQLLVKVDCPEFHARRRQIKSDLKASEAQLKNAKVTLARVAPMASRNFVSALEIDNAQAAHDSGLARVENGKARLREIDDLLVFCAMRAPFDGEIQMRWADPGGLVRPGGTPLLSVVARGMMRLQVQVVERDVTLIKDKQAVELEVNGLPGRKYKGEVTRVAPQFDPRTRTFLVEIAIPNPDGSLQPGMFGRVLLTVDQRKKAVIVPASAVLATDQGRWVFVVRDGKAYKTPVELGHDRGEEIEIRKGLRGDEDLVVLGRDLIGDGSLVKPM